jgi:Holliday junction DNA helicase RuvA
VIARLEGVLVELAPTRVLVDVRGVGYEVQIPLSTFTELPDPGKTVVLQVHTHAREGALQLFGFHTLAERAAFALLLHASRVGPKLAQTILSGISPADLLAAIRSGNALVLRAVPGIGSKMAERMLVELRDRVDALAAVLAAAGPGAAPAPTREPPSVDDVREQTLSALLNLGYPKAHAERVLGAAAADAGEGATLEVLVRAALKRLSS